MPLDALSWVPPPTTSMWDTPPPVAPLTLLVRPHPAPHETVLELSGRRARAATLEIFNAAGRRVRHWFLAPGDAAVTWNGRDESGRRVAAGVYFARLREANRTARAKIVLAR